MTSPPPSPPPPPDQQPAPVPRDDDDDDVGVGFIPRQAGDNAIFNFVNRNHILAFVVVGYVLLQGFFYYETQSHYKVDEAPAASDTNSLIKKRPSLILDIPSLDDPLPKDLVMPEPVTPANLDVYHFTQELAGNGPDTCPSEDVTKDADEEEDEDEDEVECVDDEGLKGDCCKTLCSELGCDGDECNAESAPLSESEMDRILKDQEEASGGKKLSKEEREMAKEALKNRGKPIDDLEEECCDEKDEMLDECLEDNYIVENAAKMAGVEQQGVVRDVKKHSEEGGDNGAKGNFFRKSSTGTLQACKNKVEGKDSTCAGCTEDMESFAKIIEWIRGLLDVWLKDVPELKDDNGKPIPKYKMGAAWHFIKTATGELVAMLSHWFHRDRIAGVFKAYEPEEVVRWCCSFEEAGAEKQMEFSYLGKKRKVEIPNLACQFMFCKASGMCSRLRHGIWTKLRTATVCGDFATKHVKLVRKGLEELQEKGKKIAPPARIAFDLDTLPSPDESVTEGKYAYSGVYAGHRQLLHWAKHWYKLKCMLSFYAYYDERWYNRFKQITGMVGTEDGPATINDFPVGSSEHNWLKRNREKALQNLGKRVYNPAKPPISDDKIEKLKGAGLLLEDRTDKHEAQFNAMLKKLREYRDIEGNTDIPNEVPWKELHSYLNTLRNNYNCNKVRDKRYQKKLDDEGMIWNLELYRWIRDYEECFIDRYFEYGRLNFPSSYLSSTPKMKTHCEQFVYTINLVCQGKKLAFQDPMKADLVRALGFECDNKKQLDKQKPSKAWWLKLHAYRERVEKTKDTNIKYNNRKRDQYKFTTKGGKVVNLGPWMQAMQCCHRKGILHQEKLQALNRIGWNPPEQDKVEAPSSEYDKREAAEKFLMANPFAKTMTKVVMVTVFGVSKESQREHYVKKVMEHYKSAEDGDGQEYDEIDSWYLFDMVFEKGMKFAEAWQFA